MAASSTDDERRTRTEAEHERDAARQRADTAEQERAQALARQPATAAVLRVIAGGRTDLQQVLDTILATAYRLVDVRDGGLFLDDGAVLQVGTGVDTRTSAQLQTVFAQRPLRPQRHQDAGARLDVHQSAAGDSPHGRAHAVALIALST